MDEHAATPRPTGTGVAVSALAIGAAGLIGLAVLVRGAPLAVDALGLRLAGDLATGPATLVLEAANVLGSLPVWIVIVAAIALVLARTSPRAAATLVLVNVAAEAASTAIKLIVDRARPSTADVTDLFVTSGFPSGHVTRTALMVGALLVLVPWCRRHPRPTLVAGAAAVVVMGIARVWAQAHYATDVLGAVFLAAALVAAWALARRR